MQKIDRRNELSETPDDISDGQLADYLAADLSGDNGAWNIAITEYNCPRCEVTVQVINETLDNFDTLITGWHNKASEGDCFSRFVFEYLSFIAHVKNNLYYDANSDRTAIQAIKRDQRLNQGYLEYIQKIPDAQCAWSKIIEELEQRPLRNSSLDYENPEIDKWWNSTEDTPNKESNKPSGRVLSLDDWANMIEFWYGVRNNLFHGGKEPNIKRNVFLVESAFITLRHFMNFELTKP
jgi:hypothetical protein